ncbi:MAG: cobalamin-independent methionine synthase II family protein [Pseudomonadota bacterium]
MLSLSELPTLATMGVGSYAAPGWFIQFRKTIQSGAAGPLDIEEALADATRVVVADQLDAGIDVISDGELRRSRFVYEMYQHLDGLERIPPVRKIGIAGYDMAPSFVAVDTVHAPNGFGLVDDYRFLRALLPADAQTKMAIPGPLTFGGSIAAGRRSKEDLLEEIVRSIRGELNALVAAGETYLQLDEPLFPHPPYGLTLSEGALLINRCLEGLSATTAVHICFGNNAGRPFADRRFSRLMDAMMLLQTDQLILEFANREFAEIDLLASLSTRYHIAAGVIDVKNYRVESPEDVAERIDNCLKFAPQSRLSLTADCGFSALPRYIAKQKLEALAAGARLARGAQSP